MKLLKRGCLSLCNILLASLIGLLGFTGCKTKQAIPQEVEQPPVEENPAILTPNEKGERIELMYGVPNRPFEPKRAVEENKPDSTHKKTPK